jgi:PAS domain S-box-containing protein
MWISDVRTSRFIDVNEAALRKFGYTKSAFLRMTLPEIQDDSYLLRYRTLLSDPEAAALFDKEIHALVDSAGQHTVVELDRNTIVYQENDRDLVVVTDITARINSALKDRERVEQLDIISKATSDTIWDWSLTQHTVTWNKGIKGIFGYKDVINNQTSSQWFESRIHPEDMPRIRQTLIQNLKSRNSRWKAQYRFKCADGRYKHVSDRGFVIFDSQGKASRIIGAIEDISQRREEEHWLKLLESVVINTTDGVIIGTLDHSTKKPGIIFANTAFLQMSGYTLSEIIGQSPEILHGPNTAKSAARKLRKAFREQKCCSSMELLIYDKGGKEYWVSLNMTPVSDSTGKVTHWISIQRDIAESMKYIQAIEEQNKKFKEIAWIQSHIVRAPLARVMGLVDLLKDQRPGDETDILIEHLTNSARDLDAIIVRIADKMPAVNVN